MNAANTFVMNANANVSRGHGGDRDVHEGGDVRRDSVRRMAGPIGLLGRRSHAIVPATTYDKPTNSTPAIVGPVDIGRGQDPEGRRRHGQSEKAETNGQEMGYSTSPASVAARPQAQVERHRLLLWRAAILHRLFRRSASRRARLAESVHV